MFELQCAVGAVVMGGVVIVTEAGISSQPSSKWHNHFLLGCSQQPPRSKPTSTDVCQLPALNTFPIKRGSSRIRGIVLVRGQQWDTDMLKKFLLQRCVPAPAGKKQPPPQISNIHTIIGTPRSSSGTACASQERGFKGLSLLRSSAWFTLHNL